MAVPGVSRIETFKKTLKTREKDILFVLNADMAPQPLMRYWRNQAGGSEIRGIEFDLMGGCLYFAVMEFMNENSVPYNTHNSVDARRIIRVEEQRYIRALEGKLAEIERYKESVSPEEFRKELIRLASSYKG